MRQKPVYAGGPIAAWPVAARLVGAAIHDTLGRARRLVAAERELAGAPWKVPTPTVGSTAGIDTPGP